MNWRWLTRFDPRRPALDRITLALGGLLAFGTIALSLLGQRASTIVKAEAWTIPGRPCPRVSERTYRAFRAAAPEVFRFDGARIARAYGYAICGEITTDLRWGLGPPAPVCRFNTPGAVEITTARGRFHFLTGIAPATITIEHGAPVCVLGAKLAPDWRRE
jgi:hypothetical protein